MKLKTITAVLLSAATLAAIPTVPVLRNALPGTAIIAEAADTVVTQFWEGDFGYQIYKTSKGEKYAVIVSSYDKSSLSVYATVKHNNETYPIRKIGTGAFSGKSKIATMNLSSASNLTEIGENAFTGSSVRFVEIGGSGQDLAILKDAFRNTKKLMYVYVYSSINQLRIDKNAFTGSTISDFSCYAKSLSVKSDAFYYGGQNLNFYIYSSTNNATIHEGAFKGAWLTYLDINSASITINKKAFVDPNEPRAFSLNTVRFGSFTKTIALHAQSLAGLGSLKTVYFGNNSATVTMGKNTFSGSYLETINFPATVKTIPEGCFQGCAYLTVSPITTNITTIKANAFNGAKLPSTVQISKNTTSIADTAFVYTTGIKEFKVADNNTKYKSVDGVLFSKTGTTLLCYPQLKTVTNGAYSTTASNIPDGAIYNNNNLKSLSIKNITRSDNNPIDFGMLPNLTKLYIPDADYSQDGSFILDRYAKFFYGSMVTTVNGKSMIEKPSGSEPRFISKFRSAIQARISENYEYNGFMKEYMKQMDAYVISTVTTSSMTDMEKALRIQDWIMNRVEYDPNEAEWCRQKEAGLTPDPALQSEKNHCDSSVYLHYVKDPKDNKYHYYTVCEGYAKCFRRLMQKANIETYLVSADSSYDRLNLPGHAWNIAKIGGNYYHVDVCWDDGSSGTDRFQHFMRSEAVFANTHKSVFEWTIRTFEGDKYQNPPAALRKGSTTLLQFDMNDLGRVKPKTSIDKYAVQRLEAIVAGTVTPNAYERAAGDINFDGVLNSKDVTLLKQYINTYAKSYSSVSKWRFSEMTK